MRVLACVRAYVCLRGPAGEASRRVVCQGPGRLPRGAYIAEEGSENAGHYIVKGCTLNTKGEIVSGAAPIPAESIAQKVACTPPTPPPLPAARLGVP